MKNRKTLTRSLSIALMISVLLSISSCNSNSAEPTGSVTDSSIATTESEESEKASKETEPEITTTTTAETPATYENNQYYSLEKTSSFVSSSYSGDTINIVHKVKAKTTCSIEVTAIAYDENNDVLDKSTDDVTLVKNEYNFFLFQFKDVDAKEFKNANVEFSSSLEYDFTNTIRAEDYDITQQIGTYESPFEVIMTKFNKKKDKFYLSVEFQKGYLDSFDKFRILFYKGDDIVGCEDGYFNIYAEGLKKAGDKDVIEMSIPESAKDFDNIEFFFDPAIYPF